MAFSSRAVVVASVALLVVVIAAEGHPVEFTESYYDKTCPNAHNIVRSVMERSVAANPRMAPAILRLFFHDCFVNGCDGSVLLNSTDSMESEKKAGPNASLAGYDVINDIKSELESICPATVSCADVLALASRDAVAMLGGPSWTVLLGRKDSRYVTKNATEELPDPTSGQLRELLYVFEKHGLDERDVTALSGAHTVGKTHSCKNFADRVDGEGYDDIDPSYAAELRRSCQQADNCEKDGVPFDERTPMKFDTLYYQDLLFKRGLLASDQALYTAGSWAGELVLTYSRMQTRTHPIQKHGSRKADCTDEEGAGLEEVEGAQGGERDDGGQEEPPLASGHGRPARDPQVPALDGAADPEGAVPASGARACAAAEGGPPLPELRGAGDPGGDGVVRDLAAGGHEPVRDPHAPRDDPDEGRAARAAPAR